MTVRHLNRMMTWRVVQFAFVELMEVYCPYNQTYHQSSDCHRQEGTMQWEDHLDILMDMSLELSL